MTDNNLAILRQIELEAFSREVLNKTESGYLVWTQMTPTQFKAIANNNSATELWTYYLNKNSTNDGGQSGFSYVLDVLLNNKPYMSVDKTTSNDVTEEIYKWIDSTSKRLHKNLSYASQFIQQYGGLTYNGSVSQISLTGITSAENFGQVQVLLGQTVTPSGIASQQAFGHPSISLSLALTGINSFGGVGVPIVS